MTTLTAGETFGCINVSSMTSGACDNKKRRGALSRLESQEIALFRGVGIERGHGDRAACRYTIKRVAGGPQQGFQLAGGTAGQTFKQDGGTATCEDLAHPLQNLVFGALDVDL